ncbi:histone deacetylase, putative, partial [Bodo saltans]
GSVASQRYANDLVPEEGDDEYGLTNECHPYRGMFQAALYTVWGTVYSVRSLTIQPQLPSSSLGTSSTRSIKANSSSGSNEDFFVWCAMHWWGGRHHAKCDKAGGFCYFNDVVIGVQELQKRLRQRSSCRVSSSPRILVLDIDAHHGDGTQDAFFHDPSVFTCSLHRYGVGVFPGSGRAEERGVGFGKGTCSNIPLKEGSAGAAALPVIVSEIHKIWASFAPDAAVIVCGADALVGDPLGGLNFDVGDLQTIVRLVMEKCWADMKDGHATVPTPLLILGAGGYVDTSFAKVAAAVTKDVAYWTGASSKGSSGGWEGKESPPLLSSAITCDRTPPLTTSSSTTEKTLCDEASRPPLATTTTLMVPVPDTCEYFSLYAPSFVMGGLPPAVCQKITSDGLCVPEDDTYGDEASVESESCEEVSDEEVIEDM